MTAQNVLNYCFSTQSNFVYSVIVAGRKRKLFTSRKTLLMFVFLNYFVAFFYYIVKCNKRYKVAAANGYGLITFCNMCGE